MECPMPELQRNNKFGCFWEFHHYGCIPMVLARHYSPKLPQFFASLAALQLLEDQGASVVCSNTLAKRLKIIGKSGTSSK